MNFSDLSKNYAPECLRRDHLKKNPFDQLLFWLEEARSSHVVELNAMALATASASGKPSCRTVLLKQVDERGLVFYTHYQSRKGRELAENPYAMATLFWHEHMRQICVEGRVEKTTKEESTIYFSTRSRNSQLGAWASKQDRVIASREALEKALQDCEKTFEGENIPLPQSWGGYRLIPSRFEFWQGGKWRLHDRFHYLKEDSKEWKIERLSP